MIGLWLRSLALQCRLVRRHGDHCHRGLADPADAAARRRRLVAVLDRFLPVVAARSPAGSRIACAAWRTCRPARSSSPASTSRRGRRWPSSRLFPNSAIVLKRELLFIPVVGWAMARAGNIAVERGDGAAALRGLVRQAKAAIADGRSILIFPEGTRTPVGSSGPTRSARRRSIASSACRSCRWRSIPGCSGGAASSSSGRASSMSRCCRPSRPGLGREAFMATLRERIERRDGAAGRRGSTAGTNKERC